MNIFLPQDLTDTTGGCAALSGNCHNRDDALNAVYATNSGDTGFIKTEHSSRDVFPGSSTTFSIPHGFPISSPQCDCRQFDSSI